MEFYYLTVKELGKPWNQSQQQKVEAKSWHDFVMIAQGMANDKGVEVRASTSEGYRGSGYYFNPIKKGSC